MPEAAPLFLGKEGPKMPGGNKGRQAGKAAPAWPKGGFAMP
jgi:hypothetical protein